MRPSFVPLLVAAALGVAVAASPVAAAEPFDSQLLTVLTPPPDPAFVEITDPADPGRSGPLDPTRLAELGVVLSGDAAAGLRGAAVRGFAGPSHRVIQVAYELTDAATARASLDSIPAIGEPFEVQGIPGAVGWATTAGTPTAFVGFVLGTQSFLVVVGGTDPGHALVQDTALLVVNNAAARLLPGALADDKGGGDLAAPDAGAGTDVDATPSGWRGEVESALAERDVRLALAAVAALLLFILARRGRPVPSPPPSSAFQRGATTAWRHDVAWSAAPVLPFPAGTPRPGAGGPSIEGQVAPGPVGAAPMAGTSPAPVGAGGRQDAGETYAFPGAADWPDPDA